MVVLQKLLFLLNHLTFGKRCVHASSMFLLNLLPLRLLDSRFVKLGWFRHFTFLEMRLGYLFAREVKVSLINYELLFQKCSEMGLWLFEGWIVNILQYIYLCMSTTFSWIICLGWLGPTLLKMDANSEKKRNHMVRTFLTSPSRLLIISWEDFNSYEWNLLSQIKRLWMMKGRS